MLPSLESWAGSLGYVVEIHNGRFFVDKYDAEQSFASQDEVIDFILDRIRNSCCGAS
jgi:hypothetical protein